MDFFESNEENNDILGTVSRFEQMIAKKDNYFFDCEEFQDIIEYYLSQQQTEKAEYVLSIAQSQHPYSFELKLLLSQILVLKLKFKQALQVLEEVSIVMPNDADVLIAKGSVFSKLKMSDKAIRCFQKALESAEYKDEVYYLIGNEYQRNMDFEKAIDFYKKSLSINPDNDLVLYEINMCFECTNDFKNAIAFYNRFLDANPYSDTSWFNLGGIYTRIEQWDEAIDAYEFAIAINPFFSSAYFNKANALASKGEFLKAIDAYKETYEYEAPNFITYCYVGECYERLKDYKKALKYYKKALIEAPDYADAWLGKAICLDGLEKPQDAYKCIKRALELNNEEADFWYTAGEIQEKLGYIDEAIASLKKAITIDPKDDGLQLDYLLMLDRNLDTKIVLEATEKALSIIPSNPKLMYFKTAMLLKLGLFGKAYQIFELALSLDFNAHKEIFKFYPDAANNQNILELIDLNNN